MHLFISVFLISFSLLAYEIFLMKVFSITSWSNFAYMVISIALLGFGISGSFLSFFKDKLSRNFKFTFFLFSLLYPIALFICTWVIQLVPFSPFLIVWYKVQYFYLFLYYLILTIPFFLGASCIGVSFIQFGNKIPRIYLFNMVGSGGGALMVILLMYIFFPARILFLLTTVGFIAAVVFAASVGKRYFLIATLLAIGISSIFYLYPLDLKISQYKGLSKSLNLPQARILGRYFSPLGLIHILESSAIRYAPGLSFNFKGEFPPQLAIFIDADSISVINNFQKDFSKLSYLDYLTSSLPYHLLEKPGVLILGPGGGSEVLNALYHKARWIDAVEMNPQIIKIVEKDFSDFSGRIYSLPQVKPILAEGRGYLESTSKKYDLIQISLLDSFAASSAGVYSLSESYLYTVEALTKFLEKLNPDGLLCITRWIKTPPRDGVRILSTAVEALEKSGIKTPSQNIIMIRSWSTSTLLVKKVPFSSSQIQKVLDFAEKRSFDVCWYPGISPQKVNKFHILPQPYFYKAAKEIFSPNREKFYKEYLFNITPATDDSPYFFHFFKWKSLPYLLKTLGREWIPFLEWGYIILIATLAQATLASSILIILPLFFFSRKKLSTPGKRKVFFYFLSIGVAYMFIEISFIQRFTLFLHYPVYTVAVVITGFLVFSGLGSGFSSRFAPRKNGLAFAIAGVVGFTLLYLIFLRNLFLFLIAFSDWIKIVISLALIAPLGFFMGMPFPLGLGKVSRRKPALVPWAWGINGCASVISSALAVIVAISWGFTVVGILAILLYILAYLNSPS